MEATFVEVLGYLLEILTEHLTILESPKSPIDELYAFEKRQSTYFEALAMWNLRLGYDIHDLAFSILCGEKIKRRLSILWIYYCFWYRSILLLSLSISLYNTQLDPWAIRFKLYKCGTNLIPEGLGWFVLNRVRLCWCCLTLIVVFFQSCISLSLWDCGLQQLEQTLNCKCIMSVFLSIHHG